MNRYTITAGYRKKSINCLHCALIIFNGLKRNHNLNATITDNKTGLTIDPKTINIYKQPLKREATTIRV